MVYEAEMVATAITNALLAIPGAIKNIRDLLSSEKLDNKAALRELGKLSSSLMEFSRLSFWLEEVKRLHEIMQRADQTLDDIRRQYAQATASGRFVSHEYHFSEVRKIWEVFKNTNLTEFIVFAKEVKEIESEPLIVRDDNTFVTGPEWATRILDTASKIEQGLAKYDCGDDAQVTVIADLCNQIASQVRTTMFHADERIRRGAVELGKQLSDLSSSLRDVEFQ